MENTTASEYKVTKRTAGSYRVVMPGHPGYWGIVKKDGREWSAEIRAARADGRVIQDCGTWSTRHEAIDEVVSTFKCYRYQFT